MVTIGHGAAALSHRVVRAAAVMVIATLVFGDGAPAVRAVPSPTPALFSREPARSSPAPASPTCPGNAPYSVRRPVLDATLECATRPDGSGRRQPVLLVHGAGVSAPTNWSWNYMKALPRAGFETCWVFLPSNALEDIQISAEYAARAVEVLSALTGERVDVLGHSQGGVVARWAARWFPSGARIDDVVMLGTPNHGTVTADLPTAVRACFESCWQMRRRSRLLAALNRADETPGTISYTSVFTDGDQIVRPPVTAAVAGGSNILVQDVCPGRPADHVSLVGDGMVYEIVLDALTRRSAARPAGLPAAVCSRSLMPGTSQISDLLAPDWGRGHIVGREPPLKPYARP